MYAVFLLEENVKPRKSRDKPISAFFASSLGYVDVSIIALPIDSNWSKNKKFMNYLQQIIDLAILLVNGNIKL